MSELDLDAIKQRAELSRRGCACYGGFTLGCEVCHADFAAMQDRENLVAALVELRKQLPEESPASKTTPKGTDSEETDTRGPAIVVRGSLLSGFTAVGPFRDIELAKEWFGRQHGEGWPQDITILLLESPGEKFDVIQQWSAEHEAFEAFVREEVVELKLANSSRGKFFALSSVATGWVSVWGDRPVDAVLAAAKAAKESEEPVSKPRCDHPWHRNPGLVTDCPECGEKP